LKRIGKHIKKCEIILDSFSECPIGDSSVFAMCMLDKDLNIISKNEKFSSFFECDLNFTKLNDDFFGRKDSLDSIKFIEQFKKQEDSISFLFTKRCGDEFKHILVTSNLRIINEETFIFCIFQDFSKIFHQNERIKYLSFHDELTGLYNRNYFENEVKKISDGRLDPIGMVVIDIDGMKLINDSLGHQAGDKALKEMSRLLRKTFRKSDVVCRIGGDEFSVIIPRANDSLMEMLWERLFFIYSDSQDQFSIPLSFSFGYSVGNIKDEDFENIFKRADIAMYSSKFSKKNETYRKIMNKIEKLNLS
jgi:diguanylate cyclase (GGDEF)-like protein